MLDEWRDALEDLGDNHDLALFGKTLSEEQGYLAVNDSEAAVRDFNQPV